MPHTEAKDTEMVIVEDQDDDHERAFKNKGQVAEKVLLLEQGSGSDLSPPTMQDKKRQRKEEELLEFERRMVISATSFEEDCREQ